MGEHGTENSSRTYRLLCRDIALVTVRLPARITHTADKAEVTTGSINATELQAELKH